MPPDAIPKPAAPTRAKEPTPPATVLAPSYALTPRDAPASFAASLAPGGVQPTIAPSLLPTTHCNLVMGLRKPADALPTRPTRPTRPQRLQDALRVRTDVDSCSSNSTTLPVAGSYPSRRTAPRPSWCSPACPPGSPASSLASHRPVASRCSWDPMDWSCSQPAASCSEGH